MKLTCANPRITEVELTNNMHHFSYLIDDKEVHADGNFNFIEDKNRNYIGIREEAVVRDTEDDSIILEYIPFEAYFVPDED